MPTTKARVVTNFCPGCPGCPGCLLADQTTDSRSGLVGCLSPLRGDNRQPTGATRIKRRRGIKVNGQPTNHHRQTRTCPCYAGGAALAGRNPR